MLLTALFVRNNDKYDILKFKAIKKAAVCY